jgi:hypothetical protein
LKDDFESRINEYEDTLNGKIKENQELESKLKIALEKVASLEKDL